MYNYGLVREGRLAVCFKIVDHIQLAVFYRAMYYNYQAMYYNH